MRNMLASLTGERSVCRPMTSLSLLLRKHSVKFILLPRRCRSVLTQKKSSQETLSDREGISSEHQPGQGKDETFFRFSDPEEAARSVLEERRDHILAEATSEILKQECKVDTRNTCIREFKR